MPIPNRWLPTLLLLAGCNLPDPPPARNCDTREAFWPDADGVPEAVYVGCEAPAGWVPAGDLPSDTDDGDDTGEGGDTGDTGLGDTGDTGLGDTGDTGDTGAGDTGDTGASSR